MAGISDKDLKALVDSIEYKTGYELIADGRLMRWETTHPDNYGRYTSVTVVWQSFYVPHDVDEAAALRLIFFYLAYAEDHEMRERFKVRGKRIYNPHRNGARMAIKHLLPSEAFAAKCDIWYEGDDLR